MKKIKSTILKRVDFVFSLMVCVNIYQILFLSFASIAFDRGSQRLGQRLGLFTPAKRPAERLSWWYVEALARGEWSSSL